MFVEKRPFTPVAGAGLNAAAVVYEMPNARARLERAVYQMCETYRRTHVRAAVYYDDAQLRVYRFAR